MSARACGQVVQGWEASNAIACCEVQDYTEVPGPEDDEELGEALSGDEDEEEES